MRRWNLNDRQHTTDATIRERQVNPSFRNMDQLYIERLLQRDVIESRFSNLFKDPATGDESFTGKGNSQNTINAAISKLRKELKDKETEVRRLKEVIEIKNKNAENLNNELISLNIENNLIGKRFLDLEEEHEKLVQRWLAKVQQDVETLNANLK